MPSAVKTKKAAALVTTKGDRVAEAQAAKRAARGPYISDSILARRRRMLEITKEMIAEGGEGSFTIRDLASRANVSVTTIYAAFGDKKGLIAAAIEEARA